MSIYLRDASATLPARLWAKVDKSGPHWLWTGSVNNKGYGIILIGKGRRGLTHRVAWELEVGPIPDGFELDHVCRVTLCCRPHLEHLEPVTHAENVRRSTSGASQTAKDRCPAGHLYDEANTYLYQGRRYCRECNRQQQRDGNKVRAECHPDRPHRGHGLCNACYLRRRRAAA